jgi:hypothetical protein
MTPVTNTLAAGFGSWAIGGIVLCVVILCAAHVAAGRSKIREQWAPVLDAETKRWSAKSWAELVLELSDVRAYEVEVGSKRYQVEVELLENTPQYVHVAVAVDDGSLPASFRPLATTFLRYKDASEPAEL